MYGKGAGASGAVTTAAGITLLPNTGSNSALLIFSILTIVVGGLVTTSFLFTRISTFLNK